MADREILTLKRKKIDPVITTVIEAPKLPAPIELSDSKPTKTKNIKLNRKTIRELVETYPQTFFIKNPQPLVVGIFKQLVEAMPHLPELCLQNALGSYCHKRRYLRAIIAKTHRIDLTGEPVTEITEKEKIYAEWQLVEERKRKKEKQLAKCALKESGN